MTEQEQQELKMLRKEKRQRLFMVEENEPILQQHIARQTTLNERINSVCCCRRFDDSEAYHSRFRQAYML